MKKAGVLTLCGVVAAMLVGFVGTVDARPDYKKVQDEKYKDSSIAEALAEAKCNACHYGKKKSDRNDYGKALIKAGLTEENYKEKKADKEAFAKEIAEALEKVLEEKNEAGETFGDRIKAGKLPGTNPEE
ncbi:MAG: hypothetical protein H6821_09605 [Planctomycetaceae bacterium]|nr:hypothetical protein [Planctomycetales bacterium]MCB9874417.1 hypothetical protein [Planctomycetaceae bacterium]HRX82626.1 hypothetical protein [Pirellulaceae bacterium]